MKTGAHLKSILSHRSRAKSLKKIRPGSELRTNRVVTGFRSAAVCGAPAAARPTFPMRSRTTTRCGWVCDHSRAPIPVACKFGFRVYAAGESRPPPEGGTPNFARHTLPFTHHASRITPPMIPLEILKKIRQIEIRTNRVVTETLAGQYHSVFKGPGHELRRGARIPARR